jgi:hypothetical protein
MNKWLNDNLKQEIKRVFELRYKRSLSEIEVVEIAENLTGYMEVILKWFWRNKYANKQT